MARTVRETHCAAMRPGMLFAGLSVLLGLVAGGALLCGQGSLDDPTTRAAFLELRALRIGASALAGAALAVAGTLMQGLLRNPLAGTSVLGADAGATLGGQIALLAHGALAASLPLWFAPELALPLGCLAGAALALALVLAIAGRSPGLATVILTGFILNALFASIAALVTTAAQDSWQLGRAMVAFSFGGVEGKGPRHLLLAAPLIAAGVLAAWGWGRALDLMLAGEDEAASLGVDVRATRRWTLVWTAVLTAAAVSLGGVVAFVGLVVPHALRPFFGWEHRRLVPATALGGAVFLVACDALARATPAGELPLGVVTGLIGAPVFLLLLVRARRDGELA